MAVHMRNLVRTQWARQCARTSSTQQYDNTQCTTIMTRTEVTQRHVTPLRMLSSAASGTHNGCMLLH